MNKVFIGKILVFGLFLAVYPLSALSMTAQKDTPASDGDYQVKVVYFYPTDYIYDQRYVEAIDPFVKDIQKWYADQLGGLTFYAEPAVIIKGQRNAADYRAEGPVWVNVEKEIGVECGGENRVVTLIFLSRTLEHGNGRSCGSWYSGGTNNGDITVSESTFDAQIIGLETGYCPNGFPLGDWRCSVAAQKGGIAHELGHAFSLSHPKDCDTLGYTDCDSTVMWSWWSWGQPNLGLIESESAPEKETLLTSAWFWHRLDGSK